LIDDGNKKQYKFDVIADHFKWNDWPYSAIAMQK